MFSSPREILDIGRGYFGALLRGVPRRKGLRIYRYHGVVEKRGDRLLERNQHTLETFEAQMRYLRRFRVLSLEELLAELDRPGGRRAPAVAVTFDDGFANNLLVGEVMVRLRLPWTLFAATGEIGDDRNLWLDEFSMLALHGEARSIEALGTTWPLSTREERETVFRRLRARLKSLPKDVKNPTMESIRAQFPAGESARLRERFPTLRMMTWKELDQLGASGVAIGSHGVDHDVHHAEQPREVRLFELTESRRRLEARLGHPCVAFAYPNGEYVPESPGEVGSAGYAAAFTTEIVPIDESTSRYLLPRLAAAQSLRRFVRTHSFMDPEPPTTTAAIAGAKAGVRA